MTKSKKLISALLFSAAVISPAYAQAPVAAGNSEALSEADSSTGLDDIVVTARRRAESLQDVPVAVAVISQKDLQNNVASDLNKIGEMAPQVTIGRATSGTGAVISVRGISSSPIDAGLEQSVSTNIDGVSLSRARIVRSAMFDIRQVEILQGPQALFFGKNSPAGVISIISADPSEKFEGRMIAGYEFEAKERYVEAALSGPLTDDLSARFAVRYSAMEGWLKNIAQPMANPFQPAVPLPGALDADIGPNGYNLSGRLSLLWQPTTDFTAKFKLTLGSERLNSNDAFSEPYCIDPQSKPLILGRPTVFADCAKNMVKAANSLPAPFAINLPYGNGGVPYLRGDLGLAALTLERDFGNLTLTSTSGYYFQDHSAGAIAGSAEFGQAFAMEGEKYRMFNEELRLESDFSGPLNFMIGGYFEHSTRSFYNAPVILNVFNTTTNNYLTTWSTAKGNSRSYSVFAQLRWMIVPSLELAGGARFSHERKRTRLLTLANNPLQVAAFRLYPAGVPLNLRFSDDDISPEVTLTWKPGPDQLLYAAYKTGYKSGGMSNPALMLATSSQGNMVFGPEQAEGFEAGYKADLLRNRLRLNVTAYRYDYNGLQVTSFETIGFGFNIRNAAKARTTGVTGSFEWLATDRLTLSGNAGYNRARYLSFPNGQCYSGQTAAMGCIGGVQDLSGRQLNRAPEFTFRLGGDYTADLSEDFIANVAVSAAYNGSYQTAAEYSPGGLQDSYWLLNAALHVGPKSEKYRFSLIGRNLTNSYYLITSSQQPFGAANQYVGNFNRPREIVLQAMINF